MSRYVIVGAGALGALLAAQLHEAGTDVLLVARGANLEAIRERGVIVHRPEGTDVVRVPIAAEWELVELEPSDILVLATKTQDIEIALQHWAWLPVAGGGLVADLPVVTLHNGLAAEDAALRRFAAVYPVSMWIAASHLTPGEVVSPSWPTVGIAWVGTLGTADPRLAATIASDLERADYLARVVSDVRAVKAHKLLGNLSNALDLFEGPDAAVADARARIIDEALAVYAAAGIVPIDPSAGLDVGFRDIAPQPVAGQVGGKRSTWQSFARGASSEVDYLNGEIVLTGRLFGVPTPVNERVQRSLGELAASGGGAVARDIHQLLAAPAVVDLPSRTPRKDTE